MKKLPEKEKCWRKKLSFIKRKKTVLESDVAINALNVQLTEKEKELKNM